jgi:hypothetical protein
MITLGKNCVNSQRNIGGESCLVNEGQETGHIQVPKGWSLPITEDFNKAYVTEQVLLGNFRIIGGAFGVTSETAEPTTEESTLRQLAVVSRALPVVTTTIKKGYEFHSSYYTQSGQDLYDVIPMFETGFVKVVLAPDGQSIKGFDCGMYEVMPYQPANNTVSAQTMVQYQLKDNYEVNVLGMFITDLDFNPNNGINNITDVTIIGRADVSEGKIYAKIVWSRNPSLVLGGFSATTLAISINGVDDVISGTVTRLGDEFVITPTTTLLTSQNIIVSTKGSVNNVSVIGTKYYKGESTSFNPVA